MDLHPAPRARRSLALLPVLALAGLALVAPCAAAAAVPIASFEDAEGDATGPGTYTPPTAPACQPGDFDLLRFAVLADGDEVLFVVTLGAAIRPPPGGPAQGTPSGLSLQTVDIYLDTDRAPGSGSSAGLPGRRVAFADGRTWEAAVVLTPQPEVARAVARAALGPAAERIVFPTSLTVRGRTVTARVPAASLGGAPRPDWGYSVQVSGARPAGGTTPGPDDLTMPVLPVAGPAAFGGAPPGEAHPRIVDVLLPAGADQARVLGGFDPASGAFAKVPFVDLPVTGTGRPGPVAAAPASTPSPALSPATAPAPDRDPAATPAVSLSANLMPRLSLSGPSRPPDAGAASRGGGPRAALTVSDVTGELVTARGPVDGLRPMQFGRVVDSQGIAVARVMVLRVLDQAVLFTVMAGLERVSPGQVVLVDQAPASPGTPPGDGH